MLYPKPIVDIMGEVVGKVNTNLLAKLRATTYVDSEEVTRTVGDNVSSIRYEYGHPLEIEKKLMERTLSPDLKNDMFPLIILFTDLPLEKGADIFPGKSASLNMAICMNTRPELVAEQREAQVFKPILYPIYEELMKQIDRSGYFKTQSVRQIAHTMTPRYFWGTTAAGKKFNDYLDAIEINNLNLKLY